MADIKREKSTGAQAEKPPERTRISADKPREFKKTWGKLIAYCKPQLPLIAIALVMSVVGMALTLIGPNQLKRITDIVSDGLLTGIDMHAILQIAAMLIVLFSISILFSYLQGFIMVVVTQRISKRLRSDISKKINRLPLKYFDSASYGDILSRVTNDVDTIEQTFRQTIGSLVSNFTMFIGALIMMLINNVSLMLAAVLSTLIGFGFMFIIVSKSQKYFFSQQMELGNMNGHVEEMYSGHNVIKAYNGENAAKREFDSINDRLFQSAWRSQFLSGLMAPIMGFIGNLGYVVVCAVGAAMVVKGSTSIGVVVAFMLYVRFFSQPLSSFAQAATSMQSTAAAGERVFDFLEKEEMADESCKRTVLETVRGDVRFQDVRFGYTENKPIIKGFSAEIKAGQKVALVGPTGAGKTTMVNLLMRFYEAETGEITLDGVSLRTLTRENVHALFCMVLQDTWLFEGTIRENIVYCKKDVTDEEVAVACKAAGIDHYIRTLPNGYDTVLSDKDNLSAGQRQLITIARAMVENAPLLILDEATSSVDTRTELLIQEAMDKLMTGRTSFIIAHRLSTIKNADLILVIRNGDIVESGKHEELLGRGGFYAELYNSQFEDAS